MIIDAYIDGQYGTTGLQIQQRLLEHPNVRLVTVPPEKKKELRLRRQMLNNVDVAFLCLPDAAAREAVALVKAPHTLIIDASTAHRVTPGWVYGIPELSGARAQIKNSTRISNPGCYPTGMIMLLKPLISSGLVPADYPLSVQAITGYSGGGSQMIADYENQSPEQAAEAAARLKNLDLNHKHLPEMTVHGGLKYAPVFVPTVARVKQGMLVTLALHQHAIAADAPALYHELATAYADEPFVKVFAINDNSQLREGFLEPTACNGSNRIELFVFSAADRILLAARLDNLGKGASGAAIQNMNCHFGLDETLSLVAG